jgi:hypothetical protein
MRVPPTYKYTTFANQEDIQKSVMKAYSESFKISLFQVLFFLGSYTECFFRGKI